MRNKRTPTGPVRGRRRWKAAAGCPAGRARRAPVVPTSPSRPRREGRDRRLALPRACCRIQAQTRHKPNHSICSCSMPGEGGGTTTERGALHLPPAVGAAATR
eukprot:181893-Chlamydomonas_euryale.AAC.4